MELVEVYTFSDIVEGQFLKKFLEQNGIRAEIRSFYDSAYNGIYTLTKGAGRIMVNKKDEEKARKLIEGFLKNEGSGSEGK
jgi:hypothetical protein